MFLEVYYGDSSLFSYADTKVTTVTCSLSKLKSSQIGDRPSFSYQYGLSEVKMQTVAVSLTYSSLLFFLSQTRGIQFLESCLHHHYAISSFSIPVYCFIGALEIKLVFIDSCPASIMLTAFQEYY